MRGVFLLLLLHIFCICPLYATETCTGNKGINHSGCNSGEYYDAYANECMECDAGYYCPGGDDGIAHCCATSTQGRYPDSDIGAQTSGDCFRPVNCNKHPSGTESCRYYGEQAGGQGVWYPNEISRN